METPDWSKLRGLLLKISERAKVSSAEAEQKKNQFLEGAYNDSDFESLYADYKHDWLPRAPNDFEEDFKNMNVETAFRKVYGYLQHYAVGLEQATLDQVFAHEGQFAGLFVEVQNTLKQLLCEFEASISMLKINKDPDILRDVMSVEQRRTTTQHQIMLRDYIILRDYINITNYVDKLFAYLAEHPSSMPESVSAKTYTPPSSSQ